ncbi:42998_t:CDS:2, partial [Gigaspora margarita]
ILYELEELPPINNTIVIMLNKLVRFHINVPVPVENRENQTRIASTIVSLNSGIRTFMTCYDPQGCVVEWGNKDSNQIVRLCRYLDKFQSDLSTKLTQKMVKRLKKRSSQELLDILIGILSSVLRNTLPKRVETVIG